MSLENTIGVDVLGKYSESSAVNKPPFALGTRVRWRNGRDYILARATGAVANNAAVVLTEPAMTVATGAGSWTNRTGQALVANDVCWFEKNSI